MKKRDERLVKAEALYDKAAAAYYEERTEESLALFKELLRDYGDVVEQWEVHYYLGFNHVDMREFEQAIPSLSIAYQGAAKKRADKFLFGICDSLGNAYWRLGEFAKSIKYYEEAENYIQHSMDAEWTYGRYLYRLGRGRCYVHLQRPQEALIQFEKARHELGLMDRELDSDEAVLDLETGRACYFDSQIDKALNLFRNMDIRNLPEDRVLDYHYYFSRALKDSGDYGAAFTQASRIDIPAVDDSFKGDVLNLLGSLSYWRGDYSQARKQLELSLRHKVTNDWVHEDSRRLLLALQATDIDW